MILTSLSGLAQKVAEVFIAFRAFALTKVSSIS